MVVEWLLSGRAGPVLLGSNSTLATRTAAEHGSLPFADPRVSDRGKSGLVSYTSITFMAFLMMASWDKTAVCGQNYSCPWPWGSWVVMAPVEDSCLHKGGKKCQTTKVASREMSDKASERPGGKPLTCPQSTV